MSNYTKTTNFTAKDALPTGNPSKVVSGVDMDLEFDNIQTSNNTKVDTAGSGLSITATTLSFNIAALTNVTPAAGDEFVITDVSDSGNPKAVLFSALESTLNHDSLAGFVANEHIDHTSVTITAGTGLQYTVGGTDISASATLTTNDSQIVHDSLSGFVADEHVAHGGVTLTAGTGLSGGGTIAASRTFNLDISGLTSMTAAPDGADSFLYNDGGTMKQMTFEQMAVPSNNVSTGRNFADTDVGHIVYWTGTSGTLTMVSGIGQDDCAIIVVNSGSGDCTIAGSGVTVTTAAQGLVLAAGGVAVLIRESSTVWFCGGTGLGS